MIVSVRNPATFGSPAAPSGNEGTINTLGQWATGSETYVNDPANQSFYLDKLDRVLVYGAYSWFDGGWRYADGDAIYNNSYPGKGSASPGDGNPTYDAMILRDASSNKLFIPFGAVSGGQYAQYAADVGLSAWRTDFASRIASALAAGQGSVGIMQDDVNPGSATNTVNGSGTHVDAIDPRTGAAMTGADWNRYHAEFVESNKVAVGSAELVCNMHWYAGNSGFTRGYNDAYIARIIDAADYILLENPHTGMTGDNDVAWTFSFAAFREFVDFCRTKNTNLAYFTYDHVGLEYELAFYFLFNQGSDYLGVILTSGDPSTYDAMYDIDLGSALGDAYQWTVQGIALWRRDFTGGFVLVNGPGMGTVTAQSLGGTYLDVSGASVTTVTLAAQQGAVFRNP